MSCLICDETELDGREAVCRACVERYGRQAQARLGLTTVTFDAGTTNRFSAIEFSFVADQTAHCRDTSFR